VARPPVGESGRPDCARVVVTEGTCPAKGECNRGGESDLGGGEGECSAAAAAKRAGEGDAGAPGDGGYKAGAGVGEDGVGAVGGATAVAQLSSGIAGLVGPASARLGCSETAPVVMPASREGVDALLLAQPVGGEAL